LPTSSKPNRAPCTLHSLPSPDPANAHIVVVLGRRGQALPGESHGGLRQDGR
jgi:hypothetical protein